MTGMKLSAKMLLGVAALMILRNLSQSWTELHDWHGVTATLDPAFISRIIGDILPSIVAFAAGLGLDLPASMQPVYQGPDRRGDTVTQAGTVTVHDSTTAVLPGATVTSAKG